MCVLVCVKEIFVGATSWLQLSLEQERERDRESVCACGACACVCTRARVRVLRVSVCVARVCVCAFARVCMCAYVYVCIYVCVCVRVCVSGVHARIVKRTQVCTKKSMADLYLTDIWSNLCFVPQQPLHFDILCRVGRGFLRLGGGERESCVCVWMHHVTRYESS